MEQDFDAICFLKLNRVGEMNATSTEFTQVIEVDNRTYR